MNILYSNFELQERCGRIVGKVSYEGESKEGARDTHWIFLMLYFFFFSPGPKVLFLKISTAPPSERDRQTTCKYQAKRRCYFLKKGHQNHEFSYCSVRYIAKGNFVKFHNFGVFHFSLLFMTHSHVPPQGRSHRRTRSPTPPCTGPPPAPPKLSRPPGTAENDRLCGLLTSGYPQMPGKAKVPLVAFILSRGTSITIKRQYFWLFFQVECSKICRNLERFIIWIPACDTEKYITSWNAMYI